MIQRRYFKNNLKLWVDLTPWPFNLTSLKSIMINTEVEFCIETWLGSGHWRPGSLNLCPSLCRWCCHKQDPRPISHRKVNLPALYREGVNRNWDPYPNRVCILFMDYEMSEPRAWLTSSGILKTLWPSVRMYYRDDACIWKIVRVCHISAINFFSVVGDLKSFKVSGWTVIHPSMALSSTLQIFSLNIFGLVLFSLFW